MLAACFALPGWAQAQAPAVVAAAADNGWDSSFFSYERTDELAVEISTPTPQQIDFRNRPPQYDGGEPLPQPTAVLPNPVVIGDMAVHHLRFQSVDGDVIAALLCTPADRAGPFPVAIAVHGLGSNKAQVCGQVGPALTRRGFAVLAPDMPLHGERPGDPRELWDSGNLLGTAALYRQAVINIRETIDVAGTLNLLDTTRGVVLVGYSMGSWLNSVAGPADERVRAMVLMVGGATELGRVASILPAVIAVDPRRAIVHFAGRPLLMLNARRDPVVTPEMGKRLFGAAQQPKRQVWYDSGHLLPQRAYEDAADWVAVTWRRLPQ